MVRIGLFSILFIVALSGCNAAGTGGMAAGSSVPAVSGRASGQRLPQTLHQGKNTLLLEGDASPVNSVRAFAPYFTSSTPPVFSFAFRIPGSDGTPHPFDLTTDASGKLYVAIFDDLVQGIAIYNQVPTSVGANVLPDAILSGPHTGLTRTYSVAVDKLGRIYVANVRDDGGSEIAIFAAGSGGDVAPIARISGTNTLLGGQDASDPGFTKSVRVDSSFNVYTANSIGQIAIFAGGRTGNVSPTRLIVGRNTQLVDPTIALGRDASIYAANFEGNSVTVYAPGATGNVAPIRTIKGGNTHILLPFAAAVCSDGTLYVTTRSGPAGGAVLAFNPNSNGNVIPRIVVSGGASGVNQPIALGF